MGPLPQGSAMVSALLRPRPAVLAWLVCLGVLGWSDPVRQALAAPAVFSTCKGALEPSLVGGCQLDSAGCCDPQGRVLYCVGADLYCIDCAGSFPVCGWAPTGPGASTGTYDCGTTGGADPSGAHAKACSACPSSCGAGTACSAECAGTCGTCSQPGALCLADGTCYKPQCDGKQCGLDPKGFSCGLCGPGTACEPGLQQCLSVPAACQGKKTPGCNGCGCETCVCGKYPFCCSVAWDALCAGACEAECGYSCKPCPAKPSCDGLQCGEFCGLKCGGCAAGEVCTKYKCCKPNCAGKVCGDNGCGGVCGTCSGTDECSSLGQCQKCQPKCAGKTCGDDGCGGTCGACKGTDVCVAGTCAASLCTGQCSGGPFKKPEGGDCYCDDLCSGYGDCCPGACQACPALKGCCEPNCKDKQCGDDGCGGNCGHCPGAAPCDNGKCPACQPKCDGKQCGDDGCGGQCGTCGKGVTCTDGKCGCPLSGTTTCCGASVCPIDTCGGVGAPMYACSEGCVDGACTKKCVPSCMGKACGSDGCGGLCGQCPGGYSCTGGACIKAEVDAVGDTPKDAAGDASVSGATTTGSGDGGCRAGPVGAGAGGLAALPLLLVLARRRKRLGILLLLLVSLACGSQAEPAKAAADGGALDQVAGNAGDDAQGLDAPGDARDTLVDVIADTGAGTDAGADTGTGADAAADAVADAAQDATAAVDVSEPATLVYDCANLPKGPFALQAVPGAVASEDLAFDGTGHLVGSNNSALFKTAAGAKAKLWVPGIENRAGMRFLPDGRLAMCDDKLGRILLFDEDGAQKVLVQGLSYPNGITADMQGFLYVTEHDAGRVLRIHPYSGEYTVLTKQIANPNGIIFDPEFKHLYIGSFATGWIYKLAVSPSGVPGKLIQWASPIGSGGLLDGIGVDACGNVYVCEYGNADIWRIPPSGGPAVKIVDASPDQTYLPNMQWGVGQGWDPMSIYVPDGWKIGLWRIELGVPSAPRPFP